MASSKERWGSRVGLVLAMAGNAVGLGNFLRFPAQAVQNGGGAFIIPYLVSFVLMGIPLLWVEWAIGRYGGQYGHHSTPGMLDAIGKRRWWKYAGAFGIFTNLTVAAYYSYLESWTLAYVWYSLKGAFRGMTAPEVAAFFNDFIGVTGNPTVNVPPAALFFFGITLALNVWILSRGLSKGIEIASKIGMPLLILFGIVLAVRAVTLEAGELGAMQDAVAGLNFLWEPKFDSLSNPKVWLAAAGQIFFTLSVGMGSIHTYASYLRKDDDIALNAASAGWMNEFVEVILGGSIVIPIAVAYLGLDWINGNVGLGMGFRTMPTLFENWGPFFGAAAGVAWFGLLFFAGITSSLAMGQPVMAFLQDEFGMTRKRSALMFGVFCSVLALWCIVLYGQGAFTEFDDWSGTFALVAFALVEVVAFSWAFGIENGWSEITRGSEIRVPMAFKFAIRYVTPVFLLAVFLGSLIAPLGGDWMAAFARLFAGEGWPLDGGSIVGKILHIGYTDTRWFIGETPTSLFFVDLTRILLTSVFVAIVAAIWYAWRKRAHQEGGLP